MAGKSGIKKLVIVMAVLVLAAALVFVPSLLASSQAAVTAAAGGRGGRGAGTIFSVRSANVEKQTLTSYLEVNGNIINEQQVAAVPDAGGKLVSVRAALGSVVQKGTLLAEVDPSKPGANYALSPVYAPISGTVSSNPLALGTTVSAGQSIMVISGAGAYKIEALIPEREVGQLKAGLKAAVTLQAYPNEVFNATVSTVSPVVDPTSRTKKIVLKFDKADRRVNPGMFARIKLQTQNHNNIICIPLEALVEIRGTNGVYVLGEGQAVSAAAGERPAAASPLDTDSLSQVVSFREVSVGISIDGLLEIKSGLQAGERIVIQGQQFLSDGAKVRVINRGQ
ncbi:efflux RND transporter periplasmic adaptor subunit [Breznakiellaceae bacterium SP9]